MVNTPKDLPYRRFYTKNRSWQELIAFAKEKQTQSDETAPKTQNHSPIPKGK